MDALTRFKSVLHRAHTTPAQLRADLSTGAWGALPRHPVTVRSWPPPAPADEDEAWDALIARAKMQAPSPRAPQPSQPAFARPIPPELQVTPPPELQVTPPPVRVGAAPRPQTAQDVRAKLDVVAWGNVKRPPRR